MVLRLRKSLLLRVTAYWLLVAPLPLCLYLWSTSLSVLYAFHAFFLLGWLVPIVCGQWWWQQKSRRWQGVVVFTLLWFCDFFAVYGGQRLFWNYEYLWWQQYGIWLCAVFSAALMYVQLLLTTAVANGLWHGIMRLTTWLKAYCIIALIVVALPGAVPLCYLLGHYVGDLHLLGRPSTLASTGVMWLFAVMRDWEVVLAVVTFPLMFLWQRPGPLVKRVIATIAGLMLYLGARWTYEYILIDKGADFLPSTKLLGMFLAMMGIDFFLLAAAVGLVRLIVTRGPFTCK